LGNIIKKILHTTRLLLKIIKKKIQERKKQEYYNNQKKRTKKKESFIVANIATIWTVKRFLFTFNRPGGTIHSHLNTHSSSSKDHFGNFLPFWRLFATLATFCQKTSSHTAPSFSSLAPPF